MKTKITLATLLLAFIGLSNNATAQWVATTLTSQKVNNFLVKGNTVYVAHDMGIYSSTNKGVTWSFKYLLGNTPNVKAMAYSVDTIFAVTATGATYISKNNGVSWTNPTGTKGNSAVAVSGTTIFTGDDLYIYRSSDNGKTWPTVFTGTKKINVLAVNGSNIFAGTNGNGVYLSKDNGDTWDTVNTGLTNRKILSFAVSGSKIYAGTLGNGVFLSSDNGTTWTDITSTLGTAGYLNVYGIAVDGNTVYAGVYGGGVFVTSDDANWVAMNTGLTNLSIMALTVDGTKTIYAGTSAGGVFTYPYSTTGLNKIDNSEIFSVYPNPTNGKFVINHSIKQQEICLEIYNIIGEKVWQQQNSNEVDLSNSPKGVYFLKVYDGANSCTKKIVLQ